MCENTPPPPHWPETRWEVAKPCQGRQWVKKNRDCSSQRTGRWGWYSWEPSIVWWSPVSFSFLVSGASSWEPIWHSELVCDSHIKGTGTRCLTIIWARCVELKRIACLQRWNARGQLEHGSFFIQGWSYFLTRSVNRSTLLTQLSETKRRIIPV